MMTLIEEQVDITQFNEIGINDFFPKPVTTADLFKTFTLFAPNDVVSKDINISEEDTSVKSSDNTKHEWPENTRVLLVEDNRINQMVALNVLKNIGLTADVASNGIKALSALNDANDSPYSVVIMDCQMPEMDGYEATKKIRAGDTGNVNKTIPIIAMTANAMQGDKEKCINAGMDDYLAKPIEPQSVFEKLNHWINKGS
jgi:CheY-like chemotaxis protein